MRGEGEEEEGKGYTGRGKGIGCYTVKGRRREGHLTHTSHGVAVRAAWNGPHWRPVGAAAAHTPWHL